MLNIIFLTIFLRVPVLRTHWYYPLRRKSFWGRWITFRLHLQRVQSNNTIVLIAGKSFGGRNASLNLVAAQRQSQLKCIFHLLTQPWITVQIRQEERTFSQHCVGPAAQESTQLYSPSQRVILDLWKVFYKRCLQKRWSGASARRPMTKKAPKTKNGPMNTTGI